MNQPLPIVSAALAMNDRAKQWIVQQLETRLGDLNGKRLGVLGLSFKNNTDDTRESAALHLIKHFIAKNATVCAYDAAAVIHDADTRNGFTRLDDPYRVAEHADALVIATEWDEFRLLDLPRIKSLMRGTLLIDGRNLLQPARVKDAGLDYIGVGRGQS